MTDSWETNKEMKRDDSGDRASRFFVLDGDNKIIMKRFALMILIIGLVGVCSEVGNSQTGATERGHSRDLFLRDWPPLTTESALQ